MSSGKTPQHSWGFFSRYTDLRQPPALDAYFADHCRAQTFIVDCSTAHRISADRAA